MMKILTSEQIRAVDQYTIANEPIASIDLMERASSAFVDKFVTLFDRGHSVKVFCGTGNNGGDGLAIGRLLNAQGWKVFLYVVGNPRNGSNDFKANLNRSELYAVINDVDDLPQIEGSDIIIDSLFGSGLTRPLGGFHKELVKYLNNQEAIKISIDIASGLFVSQPIEKEAVVFTPDFTFSFQIPKLPFFLPSCYPYVGEWHLLDIGLDTSYVAKQPTDFCLSEENEFISLLPKRNKFDHKNKVGRLMIVAGSKGKMGAAVLSTRAAFQAGVGLVNVCVPRCGVDIIQISIPEAMVVDGKGTNEVLYIPHVEDILAIGPGLGTHAKTLKALEELLSKAKKPIVLDADAINILAGKKALLKKIPGQSILTPHPGEFERLVGKWKNDFEKLEKLKNLCKKYQINVVLKGAYSAVCNAKGIVYFNPSGNPGLATAGSGDVLTGIIGALLAQGLAPFEALRLGVFLHGRAGDCGVYALNIPWLQASQIIDFLPNAIRSLQNEIV